MHGPPDELIRGHLRAAVVCLASRARRCSRAELQRTLASTKAVVPRATRRAMARSRNWYHMCPVGPAQAARASAPHSRPQQPPRSSSRTDEGSPKQACVHGALQVVLGTGLHLLAQVVPQGPARAHTCDSLPASIACQRLGCRRTRGLWWCRLAW